MQLRVELYARDGRRRLDVVHANAVTEDEFIRIKQLLYRARRLWLFATTTFNGVCTIMVHNLDDEDNQRQDIQNAINRGRAAAMAPVSGK